MAHQTSTETTETPTIKLKADQRRRGFLPDGTNSVTGTDRDERGYDIDGYDPQGFRPGGAHRDTGTKYNPEGYDKAGYDAAGYNADGVDKRGNRQDLHMSDYMMPILLGIATSPEPVTKRQMVPGYYAKASRSSREWHFDHSQSFDWLAAFGYIERKGRRWQVSAEGDEVLRLSLSRADYEDIPRQRAEAARREEERLAERERWKAEAQRRRGPGSAGPGHAHAAGRPSQGREPPGTDARADRPGAG